MRAKRLGLIVLLAAFVFTLFGAIGLTVRRSVSAAGEEAAVAFAGTGKTFDADESFAFAAKAEFTTAEAAGLVFGKTESGSYAFLVDRKENRVRLVKDGVTEEILKEEPFVGPLRMEADEEEIVKAKTASLSSVSLQVVLEIEEGRALISFYADGIERFVFTDGSAPALELEVSATLSSYEGGEIGYRTEGGAATFTDETVTEHECSLYAELYRNRYHYSQNSHWNNDPNGMVYYGGYYHLYYQHNPFGETWGDMYWGHARSTDLVHWENLPIALVPDRQNGEIGYMWSGSARVYHKGESAEIDGWFGEEADGKTDGEALGLLGYYTRHQENGGNLNTGIMISRNGGLTWEKKKLVPCTVSHDAEGREVTGGSWRDPKVFDISYLTNEYKWGMALTDMEDQYLFFLKSNNLVDWEDAGFLRIYCNPECPDVFPLTVDGKTHTVVTLSSRYYFVCDFGYENGKLIFKDPETGVPFSALEATDKRLQKMEYGPDSYAAQTFYIEEGRYGGQAVGLSWFSGMPNAEGSVDSGSFRTARNGWNGGGVTIPVVYGLKKNTGYGYTLTETPVVRDDPAFEKTEVTDYASLTSHCVEIEATIINPTLEPVSIRVNVSADGKYYTEIGWNKRDGYFVDRTHTETAGVAFPESTLRFASRQGKQDTELHFYILVDNGGVEVFARDFTVPFYLLTLASPYSTRIEIDTAQTAEKEITVKEISDPYRAAEAETKYLNVSVTEVELDDRLAVEADVLAYAGGEEISWRVLEGDAVSVEKTADGAKIKAVKAGSSVIEVSAGNIKRTIRASVAVKPEGSDDLTFVPAGVVSGEWHYTSSGLTGTNWGGDGFLLSEESGSDFWYSASFDLGTGAAAAIVFRATEENGRLTHYLIANYDKPGNIVKLWSENGELGRANVGNVDVSDLTISVRAKGTAIRVYFNGVQVIGAELRNNDPLEGRFGLNACATRASFRNVEKADFNLEYAGEGALSIRTITAQENWVVRNAAQSYRKVDPRYISVDGRTVTIDEDYLASLPEARSYVFILESDDEILTINVAWKGGVTEDGSNVALIVSLSVVFGVLLIAAAAVGAWFLLRRKKAAANGKESVQEIQAEEEPINDKQ